MPVATITDWPWRLHAPQGVAIRCGSDALSWQELEQQIALRAGGFALQGVTAESIIALRSANSLAALLSWLALLACGARVIVLNPHLPQEQLTLILPDLAPDFVLDLCGGLDTEIPRLTVTLQPEYRYSRWQAGNIATLTLTSGSSGLPKAVAHTFSTHLHSAAAVVQLMDFTSVDSWLLSLPIFHVSGLGILWRWLLVGATLIVPEPQGFYSALAHSRYASLVPTQLWRLLRQPSLPSGLKAVLLGGAVIAPELTRAAEAAGIRCFCGYGMTETASTVCAHRADGGAGVGTPLAGQQVTIVGDEICVRSPTLAVGYWRRGKLHPITDASGWYRSGDRGRWLHGELHIIGRCDNLFFSGAEAIQPEPIERILLAHPAVTQAFILPQEDEEYGHRPVALVETSLPLSALAHWLSEKLAHYQRPVSWYILPPVCERRGAIKHSRAELIKWVGEQAKKH